MPEKKKSSSGKPKKVIKEVKPLAVLSTDWHLKPSNKESIKGLVRQQCELANKLGVKIFFVLGDIFDSRAGQKVEELVSLDEIFDIFKEYGIECWIIPGNHDKQDYKGFKSFLHPYRNHPAIKYIDKSGGYPMGDVVFHLLPYFKESVWLDRHQELVEYVFDGEKDHRKHVLLSHTAVNGSINNDGTKVECGIASNLLHMWDLVLLGHYHNAQQVAPHVFHIPSIQQNNFGEDNKKGFTVVWDNLSTTFYKSDFKEYRKVVIDFDSVSKKELNQIVSDSVSETENIRLEIIGSASSVKAINKESLTALGFDVKIKVKEVEESIELATEEITKYNKDSILVEFQSFCDEKGKDFETGKKYLLKKLG